MKTKGRLLSLMPDFPSDKCICTFETPLNDCSELLKLKDMDLSIDVAKWRKKRSLDANGLLWHCIGEIAKALHTSKDDVYLQTLNRYGKYVYVCVSEKAAETFRRSWRLTEVVGAVNINGKKAVQLLCYYGSSQLDTKDFSVLLDGVISEMKEMGLQTPIPAEVKEAMRLYEEHHSEG